MVGASVLLCMFTASPPQVLEVHGVLPVAVWQYNSGPFSPAPWWVAGQGQQIKRDPFLSCWRSAVAAAPPRGQPAAPLKLVDGKFIADGKDVNLHGINW